MRLSVKNGIICLFILMAFHGFAQEKGFNQFDAQGKRDGKWKKQYENSDQLRYEGQFKHGQETGTFKFYKPKSGNQPAATRTYNSSNDTVVMRFFSQKGFLISKGKLVNKERVDEWNYYRKNNKRQKVMTEHYKEGKLHGWKIVYFNNGKITEKQKFHNGLKDGEDYIYGENGTLLQQYNYEKNTLQGESKVYDAKGNLKSEGRYKNGLRDGIWKFYKKGKLDKTQKYPLTRSERLAEEEKKD